MNEIGDLNRSTSDRTLTLAARLLKGLCLDGPLLVGLLLVCGLGSVVLYSAGGQNMDLIVRQGIRVALALGKALFYRQLEAPIGVAYADAGRTMACNMMDASALEGVQAFIDNPPPDWAQPAR